MFVQQAVSNPYGINVFGSSITRAEPDLASLRFGVSRLEKRPKAAFEQARRAARNVQSYLTQARMNEVGASRISLSQTIRHLGGERKLIGYTAKVGFHVLLRDLDRIEEILIGVTDAGANEIDSVDYQTSQLKEIRAEARKRAIAAAQEKAEIYCQAAGVTLGPIIHIEDVNPDQLRGREGHVVYETQPDDEGILTAFNPGSITVGGAVMVAFEIGRI